jgi:hypothetical protein
VPTRDADCFAACALVARTGSARVVGWRHSPMPYETAIFDRFGPAMTRMVGVSDWLAAELRRRWPGRDNHIGVAHNGVPVPAACPRRPQGGDCPLRLIYTGRLDEPVKRVSALPAMSARLARRGLRHRLTVVGDGPAAASLRQAAAGNDAIRFTGAIEPHRVAELLRRHDVFVLPSRTEGLSLAALEAMAAGCPLVITRTPSGAADLVGEHEAGQLADVPASADAEETGNALADALERLLARGTAAVGHAAHARARRLFSLGAMGTAADRELALAACALPPPIRAVLPFHDPARPASVPPDAADRLRALLAKIPAGGIIVHGLGAHTMALAEHLAADPRILAFADDDPDRHGDLLLGRPIIDPARAGQHAARHVVISSWMHEEAIWTRRSLYERQGLRVWRLYETPARNAG